MFGWVVFHALRERTGLINVALALEPRVVFVQDPIVSNLILGYQGPCTPPED